MSTRVLAVGLAGVNLQVKSSCCFATFCQMPAGHHVYCHVYVMLQGPP